MKLSHSCHFLTLIVLHLCVVSHCIAFEGTYQSPSSQFRAPAYGPPRNEPKRADEVMYVRSDPRCDPVLNQAPDSVKKVAVMTRRGRVVGSTVYLCDAPGVPERDRPGGNAEYAAYGYSGPRFPKLFLNVTAFLGIPYAKPPLKIHGLRFRPPEPPEKWVVLETTRYRPSCPQLVNYTGLDKMIPEVNEDCLYLNVFSPFASVQTIHKYPVMIYIHGGNYDHGSGNTFPAHMLAASQEVVVVTFNYRLGLLGFFATGDSASPGNYGLLDQAMVVQWVVENIDYFNGDSSRITLFGPGAGAASAGLLAISPKTRRHVRRVIAQSGSAVADWAVTKDAEVIRNMSIVAGNTFGCRILWSHKLVDCLRSRSDADITFTQVKPDVGWLPWAPVPDFTTREADSQFLPEDPEEFLARGFPPYEAHMDAYLTGVTRDEGVAMLRSDFEVISNNYVVTHELLQRRIREYIKIYNATLDQEAVVRAISFMYSPWSDPSNLTLVRQQLIDMYTDSWFFAGVDKMVKLLRKNGIRTYQYVLNYTIEGLRNPSWIGVPHDSEYLLASGAPFMDPSFYPSSLKLIHAYWTEADRNMSQFFMESWANFAKYGNPTPQSLFNTILWEPVGQGSLNYLVVNATNFTNLIQQDYRQLQSHFWNKYIKSLLGKPPPTWPPFQDSLQEELRLYQAAMWAVLAAVVILIFISALCSCLYCRAKRDRIGDAALDFNEINTLASHYSAPSTRANSEISLSKPRVDLTPGAYRALKYKHGEKAAYLRSMPALPTSVDLKVSSRYRRVPSTEL